MTIANFKIKVAAYLNRDPASFVVSSFDILLDAINDAHRECQQRVNFARAFTTGFISTNAFGVALSGAKTAPGGSTAVNFRVVTGAWQYVTSGSSYAKFKQYDFISEADLANILPFQNEYPFGWPEVVVPTTAQQATLKQRVYVRPGDGKIYLTGVGDLTAIWIEGFQIMPDYDAVTVTTDFILDNYHAWLLWATLQKLNGYLKEDQRVVISQRALEQAWDVVMLDDTNIRESYSTQNALN